MKTSVVLTTYNGIKYIEPLLDSLRNQTKKVDEVLICDDGSMDGTREFISKYINIHKLVGWKTYWNVENKGWKKNFKDGILLSNGDIVFPCDQDDIWEVNKIERMVEAYKTSESCLLLSSDYLPMYEHGAQRVTNYVGNEEKIEQVIFDEKFAIGGLRPGCVMAISRKLIDFAKDVWLDWYPHDSFLWTMSVILDGGYILHEPLIKYRRHSDNASNAMRRNSQAHIDAMKRTINIIEWYRNSDVRQDKKVLLMNEYLVYANLRLELLQNRKMLNWVKLINFRKFYKSLKQELGDLYLVVLNR